MLPDDAIIDDESKSDAYSMSINSIILLYKPTTIPGLSKLLDDNGYYGRYTILKKVTKNYGDTIINIEVYLPNSGFSYLWPFRTLYNMTVGRLLKKVRLKKIPAIPYVMSYLSNQAALITKFQMTTIDDLPNQLMKAYNSRDYSYYQYIVSTMIHAGLFKITTTKRIIFRLKNAEDIKEVNDNLFNPDNYLD